MNAMNRLSWMKQNDEIFADYLPEFSSPVIMQEFRSCFFANDDHISEITRKENNTRRHNQKENKEGKKGDKKRKENKKENRKRRKTKKT